MCLGDLVVYLLKNMNFIAPNQPLLTTGQLLITTRVYSLYLMDLYSTIKKIEKSHKPFRFRVMPKMLIWGPFWAQIPKSSNVGQTGFYNALTFSEETRKNIRNGKTCIRPTGPRHIAFLPIFSRTDFLQDMRFSLDDKQ